jgi:hypothetical protein
LKTTYFEKLLSYRGEISKSCYFWPSLSQNFARAGNQHFQEIFEILFFLWNVCQIWQKTIRIREALIWTRFWPWTKRPSSSSGPPVWKRKPTLERGGPARKWIWKLAKREGKEESAKERLKKSRRGRAGGVEEQGRRPGGNTSTLCWH